ncbi:MAG: hypothetical protein EXS35_06305 [Pedosphaera sp.]|nr:hypothetical protein [Pedosphaera sp.]
MTLFFAMMFAFRLVCSQTRDGQPLLPGSITANTAAVPLSRTTSPPAATNPIPELPTLHINEAVMVTVELDFGTRVPGIAEALRDVERQHTPDDGKGRVFAILDAYGGPSADGKKLHLSMHVSTEKPGVGRLVFRRTGEVLWSSRVVSGNATNMFSGKNLTILVDDGQGKTLMVDGSENPNSIMDARLRDGAQTVRGVWPDGAEREVTFLYSACGCPVKVRARRAGDLTVRASELPVIFHDDPAVVRVIERLMGWKRTP